MHLRQHDAKTYFYGHLLGARCFQCVATAILSGEPFLLTHGLWGTGVMPLEPAIEDVTCTGHQLYS